MMDRREKRHKTAKGGPAGLPTLSGSKIGGGRGGGAAASSPHQSPQPPAGGSPSQRPVSADPSKDAAAAAAAAPAPAAAAPAQVAAPSGLAKAAEGGGGGGAGGIDNSGFSFTSAKSFTTVKTYTATHYGANNPFDANNFTSATLSKDVLGPFFNGKGGTDEEELMQDIEELLELDPATLDPTAEKLYNALAAARKHIDELQTQNTFWEKKATDLNNKVREIRRKEKRRQLAGLNSEGDGGAQPS